MQEKLKQLIRDAEIKIRELPNSYLSFYFKNVFISKLKELIKEK